MKLCFLHYCWAVLIATTCHGFLRNITATLKQDTNPIQEIIKTGGMWEQQNQDETNGSQNTPLHLDHVLARYKREIQPPPSRIENTTFVQCRSDEFNCSELVTPKCIPKSYVCDGENDCGNKQDEKNCAESCGSNEFACKNGTEVVKCISTQAVCDGDNDCGDYSDEKNCNITLTTPKIECGPGTIACKSTELCISLSLHLCNRRNECQDNEDEQVCTRNGTSSCPGYLYSCSESQRCISRSLLCDGNDDCGNNEDERNCEGINYFHCSRRRQHIKSSWVCDGDNDCGDNEDEKNCFKNSTSCKSDNMFVCLGTDKCFQYQVVCNGKDDCGNGYDEENSPTNLILRNTRLRNTRLRITRLVIHVA